MELSDSELAQFSDDNSGRKFAQELMSVFKLRNRNEAINIKQALWAHHRMRAVSLTYDGVPFTIDLLNLVISGDLEVAYVVLDGMTADDGSETYHWFTAERIGWLKLEIAKHLGWA